MYRFDRVLIDPTAEILSQTLAEAAAAANKGFRARLLAWPAEDFAAFVEEWRPAAEGQRHWNGPGTHRKSGPGGDTRSAAAVVWWSDRLGRKHCRVVSERVDCGSCAERDLLEPEFDPWNKRPARPILWRVYPDDLALRQETEQWPLWAACRCGAAGPPEKLGWMGPWCAACHDRTEEGAALTRPDIYRPVVFSGHPFWVGDLAFGPGGGTLLVQVAWYSSIWIWDTVTGQATKRHFCRDHETGISALAVAEDGRTAAICVAGQVRTWSLLDGSKGPTMESRLADSRRAVTLAFSPDGTLLASLNRDYPVWRVILHESTTGRVLWSLALDHTPYHLGRRSLTFSPDGRTLALGWKDPMVRLWDVASARELPPLPGAAEDVAAIAYSPDGKTLAVGHNQAARGELWLWDLPSRSLRGNFKGPVADVAFSPTGRVLVSVGDDGCLRVRDLAGRQLGAFRWHQSKIDTVAFSPDGHWLATGGKEDRVKLWPVDALTASATA